MPSLLRLPHPLFSNLGFTEYYSFASSHLHFFPALGLRILCFIFLCLLFLCFTCCICFQLGAFSFMCPCFYPAAHPMLLISVVTVSQVCIRSVSLHLRCPFKAPPLPSTPLLSRRVLAEVAVGADLSKQIYTKPKPLNHANASSGISPGVLQVLRCSLI